MSLEKNENKNLEIKYNDNIKQESPDLDHYTKVFKGEDSQPTMSPEEKSNLEKRKLRAWRVLGWNGFIWITIRIVLYKTGLVAITEASEVMFLILYFISFYIVLKLVERVYDL